MAFTLEFKQEDGYLVVKARGEVNSFEAFSDKARRVIEQIVSSGSRRILLDDRKLSVQLDSLDISRIAGQLDSMNMQSMGLRLACLCQSEKREIYDNIETMYQNRSLNFKVFDDELSAVQWLAA